MIPKNQHLSGTFNFPFTQARDVPTTKYLSLSVGLLSASQNLKSETLKSESFRVLAEGPTRVLSVEY